MKRWILAGFVVCLLATADVSRAQEPVGDTPAKLPTKRLKTRPAPRYWGWIWVFADTSDAKKKELARVKCDLGAEITHVDDRILVDDQNQPNACGQYDGLRLSPGMHKLRIKEEDHLVQFRNHKYELQGPGGRQVTGTPQRVAGTDMYLQSHGTQYVSGIKLIDLKTDQVVLKID